MPYKSEAQRKYFNANRKKLEAEGVDVDHWNEESKGKKLPEKKALELPDLLKNKAVLGGLAGAGIGGLGGLALEAGLPRSKDDKSPRWKLPLMSALSGASAGSLTGAMHQGGFKRPDAITRLLKVNNELLRELKGDILSKQGSTGTMNIQELAKLAAGRCWDGYEPVPGKDAYSDDSCRKIGSKKKKEEKEASSCGGSHSPKPKKKKAVKSAALNQLILEKLAGERGLWDNIHAKRKRGEKPAKPGDKDYPDAKSWKKTTKESADAAIKKLVLEKIAKSPAWQREEGKSESGGLNAKGRASLKAQGQDIKAPVTQKNPKGEAKGRKSSFCARMGGMKKKLTSSETANDPDSRINKALRKWNC